MLVCALASVTQRVESTSPLLHSQACNPCMAGGLSDLFMGETDFGC